MSRNLVSAFEFILNFQGRDMTFERGVTTATIKAAPSNYFRNLAGIEEIVVEGKEFVVSKSELDRKGFPTPRRGDVIVDSILGTNSVVEVRELVIFGQLAGFRLRTA